MVSRSILQLFTMLGSSALRDLLRKNTLATLRNCSNKFLGMKVMSVYLDVLTCVWR